MFTSANLDLSCYNYIISVWFCLSVKQKRPWWKRIHQGQSL